MRQNIQVLPIMVLAAAALQLSIGCLPFQPPITSRRIQTAVYDYRLEATTSQQNQSENENERTKIRDKSFATSSSRRRFLAVAVATGVSTTIPGISTPARAATTTEWFDPSDLDGDEPIPHLPWKIDPINKRSGVTVEDAERAGYSVAFVTYLARFLLNFDTNCQLWWFSSRRIPRGKNKQSLDGVDSSSYEQLRYEQFSKFAASVEVGLAQSYANGKEGPTILLEELVQRYGTIEAYRENDNNEKDWERSAKAARRHIALLFGFLEKRQPTEALGELLVSLEDASIATVELSNNEADSEGSISYNYQLPQRKISRLSLLSGYDSSDPPAIEFGDYRNNESRVAARGHAVLKPTGRLLRIDVTDSGSVTYSKPPIVIVNNLAGDDIAEGVTNLDRDGRIKSVAILEPGNNFNIDNGDFEFRVVEPFATDAKLVKRGTNKSAATTTEPSFRVVLDNAITKIEITDPGSGYSKDKRINVYAVANSQNINRSLQQQQQQRILVGTTCPKLVSNSFMDFRTKKDMDRIEDIQRNFHRKIPYFRYSSLSIADDDFGGFQTLPFWTEKGNPGSNCEYMRLLPGGVGLEYDSRLKRYVVAVDKTFQKTYAPYLPNDGSGTTNNSNYSPLWSTFGPRARSPIERDRDLDLSEYARFGLSGAICLSAVCLTLTPLDVLKTKQQTNPSKYTSMGRSIQAVMQDEGLSTLFTGWSPTLSGNFLSGGAQYASIEFLRRTFTAMAGLDAARLEVPIILLASGIASAIAGIIYCPFETVRIRTVAQPKFATNAAGTLQRILEEEGVASLVNTVPIFLFKYVPYAITKFTVFDISTARLYEAFPAAREELQLSLLVSLAGGMLGGTAAAIVSNPSDCIISEVKKSKEADVSVFEAIATIQARGGGGVLGPFFVGLPLRILRYTTIASLSFVAYDAIRFAFGIGSDDLKLYLDVLGGALQK